MKTESTENKSLEKLALEQFLSGKSLFGKEGAFSPMLKSFIEKTLQSEMQVFLDEQRRSKGNKRVLSHCFKLAFDIYYHRYF